MAFVVKKEVLAEKTVEHGEEWCEYQEGVKLRLRGLHHKIVRVGIEVINSKQRDVRARFESGDIDALRDGFTFEEVNLRMLAELVIADWEGFVDESGQPIAYSPETALAVLNSEQGKELLIWAVGRASEVSKAAQARLEEIQGKPKPATAGKRSGQRSQAKPKSAP